MNKFKLFFLGIFTFFFIFFIFEFSSRTLIFIKSKNSDIFKYGFNKNIDLQIRKLSTFNFEVVNNKVLTEKKEFQKHNKNNKKLILAFGGSTSDVACVKENNTSWPNELEGNKFDIKNHAKSGTNSDFALNSLISSINLGIRPDIILWANYINETDPITFGFKKNKELNKKIFTNKKGKFLYFVKSSSESLKNYIIFYFLLDDAWTRIKYRLDLGEPFSSKELSDHELNVSAENYLINTIKAINLSKKLKAKFYIITLFTKHELKPIDYPNNKEKKKEKIFFKVIENIIDLNKEVKWINLKYYKINNNENIEKMFCDNIHFTTKGNIDTAKIINGYLY